MKWGVDFHEPSIHTSRHTLNSVARRPRLPLVCLLPYGAHILQQRECQVRVNGVEQGEATAPPPHTLGPPAGTTKACAAMTFFSGVIKDEERGRAGKRKFADWPGSGCACDCGLQLPLVRLALLSAYLPACLGSSFLLLPAFAACYILIAILDAGRMARLYCIAAAGSWK
jgi:hypothetical protein